MPNSNELSYLAGTVAALQAQVGVLTAGGGGGAPTDAKYIVQEAHGSLSAEQSLGALATGILKNTATASVGVLSIAAGQADFPGLTTGDGPTFDHLHLTTDLAVAEGGTGASTFTDHGVLYGQAANAIGATAEGATGTYLAGTTGNAPSFATLNQAAVAGLTTADGPTFDHLHITTGPVALADGDVTMPSGHGIDFAAAHSANTHSKLILDAYEEGTWTPVYAGTTGTIGATAYSTQTGWYTKVGRLVTAGATIVLTNNGDWTGSVKITGLPFTAGGFGWGALLVSNITYDGQLVVSPETGQTYCTVYVSKTATALAALACTGVPDNGRFYFTVTYMV